MCQITQIGSVPLILALICSLASATRIVPNDRIAGGQFTTVEEFPHQVYISHFNMTHCGGSIISKRTIVTAAHCIEPANKAALEIRVGVTDVLQKGEGSRMKIAKTIVHEDYSDRTIRNDIALVILSEPLKFSDSVRPIKLPHQGEEMIPESSGFVSGWGLEAENQPHPTVLKYVEVFIVDHDECARKFGSYNIWNKMICAGRRDKGHPCSSDSGGPLTVYNSKGEAKLIGIVSFGMKCSISGAPGVYTKVSAYRNWIEKHME